MWPPVMEQHSIRRSRISCASWGSCSRREALEVGGRLDGREQAHRQARSVRRCHPERSEGGHARAWPPFASLRVDSARNSCVSNIPGQGPQRPARDPRRLQVRRPPAGPAARPPPGRRPCPARLTYVDLASWASRPAVLPSSSLVPVASRTSSAIWKARPMSSPYAVSAATSAGPASAAIAAQGAGGTDEGSGLSPVHRDQLGQRRACGLPPRGPATARPPSPRFRRRGTARPPSGPALPAGSASCVRRRGEHAGGHRHQQVAGPGRGGDVEGAWVVGRPRRRSSSSMQGRSSWTSE